jgi:hypothetical protein
MSEYKDGKDVDVKGRVLDGSFFNIEDKTFNFGAIVCSSHPKVHPLYSSTPLIHSTHPLIITCHSPPPCCL